MKKLLALLLASVLLCSSALADLYNLGDFNMDLDPDMPGVLNERVNGQPFLYLYPFYNDEDAFHSNINVVWLEDVEDLTVQDPQEFAQQAAISAVQSLEATGIAASNGMVYAAQLDEQDGVPSIEAMYSFDVDFSPLGADLQCTLYYVVCVISVEGVGSYVFTITTDSIELLDPMGEILGTVTWNF